MRGSALGLDALLRLTHLTGLGMRFFEGLGVLKSF